MTKTPCAVSREQFRRGAKPLPVRIGDVPMTADPKEFSTGSLGFNISQKMTVLIDGVPCNCQVGLNVTVVGSKDAV